MPGTLLIMVSESVSPSMSEQGVLRISILATVVIAITGLVFGALSGSFSIMFDGSYSLVDAVMSAVALMVARLITRDAAGLVPNRRFTMGFWHLEPIVLALNGMLLMAVSVFALVNAIGLILNGGRELEFDWAIIYAVVTVVVCIGMYLFGKRANRSIGSSFIALDAYAWAMSGGITAALLVAFCLGYAMQGTAYAHLTSYVDPVVLAIVCVIIIPLPFGTVRRAVSDILLAAPRDLVAHVAEVARETVARHGFLDYEAYVARIGRATQVEIHFIVPQDLPITGVSDFDAIRAEVGEAIGGEGPDRWLTLAFTADPKWAS